MTQEAVKVLDALKVQGIEDTPMIKRRVGELLSKIGFTETIKAIYSNQSLFTSSAPIPEPAPSTASVWAGIPAPLFDPTITATPPRTDPPADTQTEAATEPWKTPRTAKSLQVDIDVYEMLSPPERAALRDKLETDKPLARLTGQALFGRDRKENRTSFVCPCCGNGNPGVICSDEMRKLYFICRNCKQRGSLFQFQALRNGRRTATAEDFLTVEAVAYDVDTMR